MKNSKHATDTATSLPTASSDTTKSVASKASQRIECALQRNQKLEILISTLLSILFMVGLALLVLAIVERRWELAAISGLFELAIAFPINSLVKLRKENLRLQILPELIELADETDGHDAKHLVVQLVARLIEQI